MEKQHEWTAQDLINTTVETEEGSAVISTLQRKKEMLEASERATVEHYISEMRPIYAAMLVDNLGGNIAGLYDGSSIYVDSGVVQMNGSIDTTLAQAWEVYDHENYHKENKHTSPMTVMADTRGDIAAVIGGVEFTETALIEGLTVKQTGDQFVSVQYVEYKNMVERALDSSGRTIGELEQAVNEKKDLTLVDDRAQAPEAIAL